MIFVTLGTQDKPFNRLLEAIKEQIDKRNIKEKVIIQAGCTKFKCDYMEIFDLVPMDDFDKYMQEASLIITHGGVGSIINGLNKNKTVIAVPRLAKYGEHVNDHQVQIVENFDKEGYIIGIENLDNLSDALKKAKKFKPKKFKSNRDKMVNLVCELIDK